MRPKCSLCTNLGFDCQYEPTESSTNVIVKKEYVSDVDTRLKVVEDLLRRHDDLLRGHLSSCHTEPSSQSGSSPVKHLPPRPSMPMRDSIQVDVSELEQDHATEETLTDGMALSFVDEMNTAFFGPSSNIAFTRHILRAMARSINQPKPPPTQRASGGILDYSRAPSPSSPDLVGVPASSGFNMYELPPVAEM